MATTIPPPVTLLPYTNNTTNNTNNNTNTNSNNTTNNSSTESSILDSLKNLDTNLLLILGGSVLLFAMLFK